MSEVVEVAPAETAQKSCPTAMAECVQPPCEEPEYRDYSCVYVEIPSPLRNETLHLATSIDPSDLHEKGVEQEPHVTILYGLHTEDVNVVQSKLAHKKAIKASVGSTSLFEVRKDGEEYDVLKLDVVSDSLVELNSALSELGHTTDHPQYTPHVTLAYLKAGTGTKYTRNSSLAGREFTTPDLVFAGRQKQCGKRGIRLNPVNYLGLTVDESISVENPSADAQFAAFDKDAYQWPSRSCSDCYFFRRGEEWDGQCGILKRTVSLRDSCRYQISEYDQAYADMAVAAAYSATAESKIHKSEASESRDEFTSRMMDALKGEFWRTDIRKAVCDALWSKDADEVSATCRIIKAEETPTFTLIRGAVLIPDSPDHQGDVVSADEVKYAAHRYMEGTQQAGLMHKVMVAKRHVHLVESYVSQSDMTISGESIPKGSWVVAFRVYDTTLRESIAKGEIAGFSIGGRGRRTP